MIPERAQATDGRPTKRPEQGPAPTQTLPSASTTTTTGHPLTLLDVGLARDNAPIMTHSHRHSPASGALLGALASAGLDPSGIAHRASRVRTYDVRTHPSESVWIPMQHRWADIGSQGSGDRSIGRMTFRSGFTIIELLFVVMLISILMSMAMFMISTAQRSAARASSQSIMHKVDTALRLYKTDFHAYPYQTSYPPTDPGQWTNTLYYHLGVDISESDAAAIHADMDTAAKNYSYSCVNPNASKFTIQCADPNNPLNPWNDMWENPTGNPHQFLRGDTWDKKIASAAVLNRMAAERARLIMFVGGVEVGGVHRPAIPSGKYAQADKDLSGIRLVPLPQSSSGSHKPGWASDYLQGELESRHISGDAVLDAHFHPLVYICQVVMGVRSTETMLFHQAEFCEHPEFFGLATVGRKTLEHTADPDPAGGLADPANLMASDITTYAAPGLEIEFELWSTGNDGRFSRMRNDPANADNVPCENYNKGLGQ